MIHSSIHTHSVYCDGRNTLSEMAASAYDSGLKCIGFSAHSFVANDGFGMKLAEMPQYIAEAMVLKEKYKGKMDVMTGLEFDSFSDRSLLEYDFDYIIGSSHAVMDDSGEYCIVDGRIEKLIEGVEKGFKGDFLSMCEEYFRQHSNFVCDLKPDIIGHFDLVTKHNKGNRFFDESAPRYKKAALDAIDAVLDTDSIIEVNVGAMNRGFTPHPYPSDFILKRVREKNGRVIITADSHSVDQLIAKTDIAEEILRAYGFSTVMELSASGFYERRI